MSAELRECPFCGCAPVGDFYTDYDGSNEWAIFCIDDSCPVETCLVRGSNRHEAESLWNLRADDRYELTDAGRKGRG